jgi:magnesium transporter
MKSPLIIIQNDDSSILQGNGLNIEVNISNLSNDNSPSILSKSSVRSKTPSWLNFKKLKLILGHSSNNSIANSINTFNTTNSYYNGDSGLDDMYKTTFYSNSSLVQLDTILEKSTNYWSSELSSSKCYWLDIKGVTSKELEIIKSLLKLTNLTLNQLQSPSNLETWHQYDSYFYFGIILPCNQNYLHVLITNNGVLTLTQAANSSRMKVIQRVLGLAPHLDVNPELITYLLLDFIIDEIILLVNNLELDIDVLDDKLFIKTKKSNIILNESVITKLEVNQLALIQLQKLISGKKDLIRCLSRRYLINPSLKLYLGDLDDHLLTSLTNLHFLEKQLTRIQSTITAQKSYENLKQNYNSIRPSLNLMYLGIVFSISSIISTIWGIRCIVPGQRLIYKELFPYSNFILIEFGSILLGGFLTWLANWYLIGVRGC